MNGRKLLPLSVFLFKQESFLQSKHTLFCSGLTAGLITNNNWLYPSECLQVLVHLPGPWPWEGAQGTELTSHSFSGNFSQLPSGKGQVGKQQSEAESGRAVWNDSLRISEHLHHPGLGTGTGHGAGPGFTTLFHFPWNPSPTTAAKEVFKAALLTCYQYFLGIFCSLHNPLKWSPRSSWQGGRRAANAKQNRPKFVSFLQTFTAGS